MHINSFGIIVFFFREGIFLTREQKGKSGREQKSDREKPAKM